MVLEVKSVITSGEERGREGFLGYQQYFFIWVMIIQVYSDNLWSWTLMGSCMSLYIMLQFNKKSALKVSDLKKNI